ncbi:thiamine biosynthesis protein ThiF [Brevirhabdus pacifica]|uniref:Thiamine biosynthesis protein ThiF n=2 Tax=Brevirhabdus pacifica TaxID=1267768 RepID=A0A1U7DLL7_9RHOB|nr:HesA/MoeB/ThiF family protein [Brevirhabdus pacifica]APX90768.1 thiamine biosynthesis protein ThiF [Brevirhabdus pacifica]PJJ87354.1 molybdopterin/thiamine biosynthesis adenylyltransferase [Brevirhabdus pacifica]
MSGAERYLRQTNLPEVGAAGQARLSSAHALVLGAGGLAAPVLQYLAGAGLGRLSIIDPDRVELSNLHRQTLFTEADQGRPKAEAAAAFCTRLNGDVRADGIVAAFDPASAPALVQAADLVLDCTDSFAAKYVASDACMAAGKPLFSASVLGLDGYAAGFCDGAPSYRALFPELPESARTCASAGVLGPVVGMIGSLQAQMAMTWILGLDPSPLGQFLRYEGGPMRFSSFRFDGAPEPAGGPRFIAPGQITEADDVLDLRPASEAPHPVAPHANRRDAEDTSPLTPRPGRRLVLACRSGLRAARAARHLPPDWQGEVVLVAAGDPLTHDMNRSDQPTGKKQ